MSPLLSLFLANFTAEEPIDTTVNPEANGDGVVTEDEFDFANEPLIIDFSDGESAGQPDSLFEFSTFSSFEAPVFEAPVETSSFFDVG